MHAVAIDGTRYTFPDLKCLLAKASPARSGDRLAGIAAETSAERVAAQLALADVPLAAFLNEVVIPYEDDEVTRLIIDSHDAASLRAGRAPDGRRVSRLAARRRGHRRRRWPRWRPASRRRWRRPSPRSAATRT